MSIATITTILAFSLRDRAWSGLSTVGLILILLGIGAILYWWPELDAGIKKMLKAIAIVCFVLWLLVIVLSVLAHYDVP